MVAGVFAQENALYTLKNVPQSLRANISHMPKYNYYIGIPVLSSINFQVTNSAFTMSELFPANSDGSLRLGLADIAEKVNNRAVFRFRTDLDLINFGFRVDDNRNFLHFSLQEIIDVQFAFNKDLLMLAAYGNAHAFNRGREIRINRLGLKFNHYTKLGVGYTYYNRSGTLYTIRPHLNLGKAFVNTQGTYLNLYTGSSLEQIAVQGNLLIKQSGGPMVVDSMGRFQFEQLNIGGQIGGFFRNFGFGMDFAMKKEVGPNQTINFSVMDLGAIIWSYKPYTINTSNIDVEFNGLDLADIGADGDNDENSSNTAIDDTTAQQGVFIDSMLGIVDSQLTLQTGKAAFLAPTSTKIYLGTTFHITDEFDFDVFFRAQVLSGYFHQSITLAPSYYTKTGFGITGTYSIIGNTFNNLGFGLSYNVGPVQMFFVSDNLLGLTQVDFAKNINLMFGFNIMPRSNKRRGAFQKPKKGNF